MEKITEEELLKLLNESKKERVNKCNEAITKALQEYNCTLTVSPEIRVNDQLAVVALIAK